MNQDNEHLRLLSIFHYVVGGLATLFSFLPLLYSAMGIFFVYAAHHGGKAPGREAPPEVVGWALMALGGFFFLMGLAMAVCILLSGRALEKRDRYWFIFVMACIECLFMPFGTILGIFTLLVLSRESVKKQFFPARGRVVAEHPSSLG